MLILWHDEVCAWSNWQTSDQMPDEEQDLHVLEGKAQWKGPSEKRMQDNFALLRILVGKIQPREL